MNAIEAINHYAQRGHRVDGVLQHIVVSEIEHLKNELTKTEKLLDISEKELFKLREVVNQMKVKPVPVKLVAHTNAQTSNIDIWDYEEIHNPQINALQAINHYLQQGERVDGVLHHIVTSEINRLQEMLEGNDGMSVKEIRAQFVDLHRQLQAAKRKNVRLGRAMSDILDIEATDLSSYERKVITIADQALRGEAI
ncbi:hypothetical protein A0U40_14080 [[Bacillus] sp. KCTC 13219]|nr:hypothetical protein A0U40_14080 [[Bacillus] sp. KCTC 13219]